MRRIDETHRVLGLVAVAVTVGLSVAGFTNGSADAHGERGAALKQERSAFDPAAAPARQVRVVYGGVIGGKSVKATGGPVSAAAAPVTTQPTPQRAAEPAVTGSIARPETLPVRLASRYENVASLTGPDPRADAAQPGLDLNSASIEELDRLGGGRIGKAIARRRPYSSPEDLLAKRVLNRATYARISGQVTVR